MLKLYRIWIITVLWGTLLFTGFDFCSLKVPLKGLSYNLVDMFLLVDQWDWDVDDYPDLADCITSIRNGEEAIFYSCLIKAISSAERLTYFIDDVGVNEVLEKLKQFYENFSLEDLGVLGLASHALLSKSEVELGDEYRESTAKTVTRNPSFDDRLAFVNIIMDNQGELKFRELTTNGTNAISVQAPASLATNYTITLPPDDGTVGQVLQTNGSGVLGWVGASGISGVILDGGNTEGAAITIGTNDNFALNFESNGTTHVTLDTAGDVTMNNDLTVSGVINLPRSTSATVGNIFKDGNRFIHDFGGDATTKNLFIGDNAGNFTTTGTENLAIGTNSMALNTTGDRTLAVGWNALANNTTGILNTAIGHEAMRFNTTGSDNVALGEDALMANTIGNGNTAIGEDALERNTDGNFNVAIGNDALENIVSGSNNNTAFGALAGFNLTSGSDNIYINNGGIATESGVIKIGTTGTQTTCFIAGINDVTTSAAARPVVVDTNGQLGTASTAAYRAHVYLGSNQNVTGTEILEFNTEAYDSNNNFNTATHLYTAPITGYYFVSVNLSGDYSSNNTRTLQLIVNGSPVTGYSIQTDRRDSRTLTAIINLTAGNTLGAQLTNTGGTAVALANHTSMSIHFISG